MFPSLFRSNSGSSTGSLIQLDGSPSIGFSSSSSMLFGIISPGFTSFSGFTVGGGGFPLAAVNVSLVKAEHKPSHIFRWDSSVQLSFDSSVLSGFFLFLLESCGCAFATTCSCCCGPAIVAFTCACSWYSFWRFLSRTSDVSVVLKNSESCLSLIMRCHSALVQSKHRLSIFF
jgi:hypothetical protein